MFRRRRGTIPEEGTFTLVGNYVRIMGYPDSLAQKVLRKYKRGTNDSKRIDLQRQWEETSKSDDEGSLESQILGAIPEKNRSDCYWFLYGTMMRQSAFFQGLGGEATTGELQLFLRGLCMRVKREHLPEGDAMNLGPKNHGSIIFVRRGSLRLYLGDKMIAILGAGTVFDIGVLSADRFGVFCQALGVGESNDRANSETVSSNIFKSNDNSSIGDKMDSHQQNLRLTDKKLLLKYVRLEARSVTAPAPEVERYEFGCEYGVLTVEMLYELLEYDVNRPFKISFTQIVLEERRRVSEAIGRHKTAIENHRQQVMSENVRAANKQLLSAVEIGSLERIRAAVSLGARLSDGITDLARTALHVAILSGRAEVVGLLLELGSDPNAQDVDGCTPLHLACHQSGTTEVETIIELLLSHGSLPTKKDSDLDTPFHYTAGRGEIQLLSCLVQSTKDWEKPVDFFALQNNEGKTPFALCATQQAKRILKPRTKMDGGCR